MKNSTKILVLALSLALLVGVAVGFSASANGTAPEIVSKNVKVDGNYSLMFAVDPATVAGEDVTLTIYAEAPAEGVEAVQTITKAKTDTTLIALDGDRVEDDAMIVFETRGVSAKDIADVWYITTTSAGVTSEAETYSVREYAYERLYKNGTIFASADDADKYKFYQKQFYLELLDVGSAAQQLLVNKDLVAEGKAPETLAKDYTYVYVTNGTYTVGGATAGLGFVDKNASLALSANAGTVADSWNVYTFDKNGVLISEKAITAGEALTVAGNSVILPYNMGVTPGKYFAEVGNPLYKMDGLSWKDQQGSSNGTNLFAHSGFSAEAKDSDGVKHSISYYKFENCGDPDFGSVLKFGKPVDAVAGCQGTFHFPIEAGEAGANCVVVEFDFKYNSATTHKFDNLKPNSAGELLTSVFFTGFSSNTLAQYKVWGSLTKLTSFAWQSVDYDTVLDANNQGGDAFRIESTSKDFDLLPETWYNICFEIYPSDNAIVIYIDGVKAGSWIPSTYTMADISQFNLVSFMVDYRLLNCELSMDNVFAGKVVKEYVAP
jgi:hypothetical protein